MSITLSREYVLFTTSQGTIGETFDYYTIGGNGVLHPAFLKAVYLNFNKFN